MPRKKIETDPALRERGRRLRLGGASIRDLAPMFRMGWRTLYKRAEEWGWPAPDPARAAVVRGGPRPPEAPAPPAAAAAMEPPPPARGAAGRSSAAIVRASIARELEALEAEPALPEALERRARSLAAITRTLAMLGELERDEAAQAQAATTRARDEAADRATFHRLVDGLRHQAREQRAPDGAERPPEPPAPLAIREQPSAEAAAPAPAPPPPAPPEPPRRPAPRLDSEWWRAPPFRRR